MKKLPENWGIKGCPELQRHIQKTKGTCNDFGSSEDYYYYRNMKLPNHWHRTQNIPKSIITFQQHLDSLEPEKEIIGYRIVKPEYAEAAEKISDIPSYDFLAECLLENRHKKAWQHRISLLKTSGVLDLWFEPVYKEEEKVFIVGGVEVRVKDKVAICQNADINHIVNGISLYHFDSSLGEILEVVFKKHSVFMGIGESKLSEWMEVYNAIK